MMQVLLCVLRVTWFEVHPTYFLARVLQTVIGFLHVRLLKVHPAYFLVNVKAALVRDSGAAAVSVVV
jgi:hypothetical protein